MRRYHAMQDHWAHFGPPVYIAVAAYMKLVKPRKKRRGPPAPPGGPQAAKDGPPVLGQPPGAAGPPVAIPAPGETATPRPSMMDEETARAFVARFTAAGGVRQ